MTPDLSLFQRRLAAVSLLFIVSSAVAAGLILPVVNQFTHYRDAIDDLEFKLTRYWRLAATREPLQQQLAELKNELESQQYLIIRETPALATADLQQQIGKTIAEQGGQLRSTQVIPIQNEDGFIRLALRVQMTGDINVLRGVFYALEAGRPLLFIDNIQIRPDQRRVRVRRQKRSSYEIRESGNITVTFDVIGYMRATVAE